MLVVWLPLNGNLNNQGLSDITVTGTPAYGNGKIGKNALDLINSQQIKITCPNLNNVSKFSICFWIIGTKDTSDVDWSSPINFSANKSGGTENTSFRFGKDNRASVDGYPICMFNNSSYPIATSNSLTFASASDWGKWIHVCMTTDGVNLKSYVNGDLKTSATNGTNGFLTGTINLRAARYNGFLNDFRVYDHCLSQKEIKELSRGLVLHYKLSGFSGENLFGNGSDFQTSLDGFSSKSNFSITTEDGIKCAHATGALKTSAYIYSKIPFTPQPNEWVTLSAYVKIKNIVRGTTNPMCEFYFSGQTIDGTWRSTLYRDFRVDGTQVPLSSIGFDKSTSFNINDNKWHYVSATVQWQNYTFTSNIPPAIYLRDCTGDMYVHHIKYERGDKATLWCPNSGDTMYTTHGFNTTIEDDCSGYSHDGTKTGSLTLSSDTPRYATSTVFNGSSYITVQNNDYAIQGIEEMSCSVWAYDDDWSTYSGRIYSCTEGGGINIEQSGTKLQWAINAYSNAEKTSYSYPSSLYITIENSTLSPGWHLFTWTYTTEGTKVYVDGVLKVIKTATSYGIHFNNTAPLIIGGEATATGATTPYLTGKLSDFRIYATALSDDDVKELYQVSASIDNQGNLHTYEVIER